VSKYYAVKGLLVGKNPEIVFSESSGNLVCEWVESQLKTGVEPKEITIIEGRIIPFKLKVELADSEGGIVSETAEIEALNDSLQKIEECTANPRKTTTARKKRGPYKQRKPKAIAHKQDIPVEDYPLPCKTCRNSHRDSKGNYPPCKDGKFTKTSNGLDICSIWWGKEDKA
jgi:hypothetical protein